MTDSLIFIAQRKSRDIIQTWKYSPHCNCGVKDDWQNATLVVSFEKFGMILLFLRYFRVPFDWNSMSMYIVKYFFMSDIGMIFSCRWHVNIIACRRQPYLVLWSACFACQHNSSFKIEWNTHQKNCKSKCVTRYSKRYLKSAPTCVRFLETQYLKRVNSHNSGPCPSWPNP